MTDVMLEERLARLADDLEQTRREVRALQRERRAAARPLTLNAGLIALGLLALGAQSFSGQAPAAPQLLTTYTAPLRIVDTAGRSIVEVSDDPLNWGLTVYGPAGPTTRIGTTGDGAGSILLMAAGQTNPKTGQTSQKDVLDLGSRGIRFFGKAGSKELAVMDLVEGAPRVAVFNSAGAAVAALKENSHHGGSVAAGDADGNAVFQAGFTGTGGAACVNTAKRGEQCLGIGLPLGH